MWRTRGRGNELFKVCERLLSIGRNISCIFFLTEASVKEAHRQEREDKVSNNYLDILLQYMR